jgi:hypothetical protein
VTAYGTINAVRRIIKITSLPLHLKRLKEKAEIVEVSKTPSSTKITIVKLLRKYLPKG